MFSPQDSIRRVRQADFAPAGGTPATITQSDGQRLLKAREGRGQEGLETVPLELLAEQGCFDLGRG